MSAEVPDSIDLHPCLSDEVFGPLVQEMVSYGDVETLGSTSFVDVNRFGGMHVAVSYRGSLQARLFFEVQGPNRESLRDSLMMALKAEFGPINPPKFPSLGGRRSLSFMAHPVILPEDILACAERNEVPISRVIISVSPTGRALFQKFGIPINRGECGKQVVEKDLLGWFEGD